MVIKGLGYVFVFAFCLGAIKKACQLNDLGPFNSAQMVQRLMI